MKQVILKQKMKNHLHDFVVVVVVVVVIVVVVVVVVVWYDTHSYRELTIFAKAYLPNLKFIKWGEIQKLNPKNREKYL